MVLVALITLFDGLARLLKFIGVETEDSVELNGCCCSGVTKQGLLSVEDEEKIQLGKSIITNEIKQEAINFLHWKSSIRHKDTINTNRPVVTSSSSKMEESSTKGKVGLSLLPMACNSTAGFAAPHRNRNYENISNNEEKLDDVDDISIDFNNYMTRSPVFSPVKSTDSDFDENSMHPLQPDGRISGWGSDGSRNNRLNSSLFGVGGHSSNARNGHNQHRNNGGDFQLQDEEGEMATGGRYSDI